MPWQVLDTKNCSTQNSRLASKTNEPSNWLLIPHSPVLESFFHLRPIFENDVVLLSTNQSPQIRVFTSATRHVKRSPQSTGSCATTSYPLRSRQWWNTSLAFSGCVKIFGQGWLSRRARCCRSSVGLEETWIPFRSCHDPENQNNGNETAEIGIQSKEITGGSILLTTTTPCIRQSGPSMPTSSNYIVGCAKVAFNSFAASDRKVVVHASSLCIECRAPNCSTMTRICWSAFRASKLMTSLCQNVSRANASGETISSRKRKQMQKVWSQKPQLGAEWPVPIHQSKTVHALKKGALQESILNIHGEKKNIGRLAHLTMQGI